MTLYDLLELSREEVRNFGWEDDGAAEEPEEDPEEEELEGDDSFLAEASKNLSKPRRSDPRQFVVVALLLVRGNEKYVLSVASL